MLNIKCLNVCYGDSVILRDVNLKVSPGQVVCLMGRNGVGKTTLLKSVMGLLRPRSGTVSFDGHDVTNRRPDERARRGIGYVPQGRDIFPQLTVRENLLSGLEARRVKSREIPEDVLYMFPVLEKMFARRGGDLSGGQQQQLAIARALVSRPKLLLLDEPTEGIQPSIVLEIARVIRLLRAQGTCTLLLVEQYLEFVLDLADAYYVMEKGSIVSHGLISELDDRVVQEHLAF